MSNVGVISSHVGNLLDRRDVPDAGRGARWTYRLGRQALCYNIIVEFGQKGNMPPTSAEKKAYRTQYAVTHRAKKALLDAISSIFNKRGT
jgi:hypothetical protein